MTLIEGTRPCLRMQQVLGAATQLLSGIRCDEFHVTFLAVSTKNRPLLNPQDAAATESTMSMFLIDGIKDVVFHNGIVRIDCVAAGPGGEQRHAGTLVIPANVTGVILQSLANAMQELDKKMHEHAAEQAAKATESGPKN
jgi:hypothetical protein